MGTLEFDDFLTDARIEAAYGLTCRMRDARNQGFADVGYRAAIARDPKLLKALERMAESTNKLQERQMGRLMRSSDATHGETRGTTEHQLCREAYRMVDQGTPIRNFEWIYGAAAHLCGYG